MASHHSLFLTWRLIRRGWAWVDQDLRVPVAYPVRLVYNQTSQACKLGSGFLHSSVTQTRVHVCGRNIRHTNLTVGEVEAQSSRQLIVKPDAFDSIRVIRPMPK